ncbi:MAG: HisA/HisF-related TIM barrel protein [Phyllobacterium sp.]
MHIIPVLDIKDDLVVRAKMGLRDSYQPITTPLSPTAQVPDVAQGLRSLYPFPIFYVADLDRIERRREVAFDQLKPLLGQMKIWLDAGFRDERQLQQALELDGLWPVLGSESQTDWSLLDAFHANPKLILSLDFRGGQFLGPAAILENVERWPSRVIVMTLSRVGADSGPDFKCLERIKRQAGDRSVIAAGGVRNRQDLEALEAMGVAAALVASSLHNGMLTAEEISALMGNSDS